MCQGGGAGRLRTVVPTAPSFIHYSQLVYVRDFRSSTPWVNMRLKGGAKLFYKNFTKPLYNP